MKYLVAFIIFIFIVAAYLYIGIHGIVIHKDIDSWKTVEKNKPYVLKDEMFLMMISNGVAPPRLAMGVPGSPKLSRFSLKGDCYLRTPESVSEVLKNRTQYSRHSNQLDEVSRISSDIVNGETKILFKGTYPYRFEKEVVDILPANTEFIPYKLKHSYRWDILGTHELSVEYAKILSGKYKDRIVDIHDLICSGTEYISEAKVVAN